MKKATRDGLIEDHLYLLGLIASKMKNGLPRVVASEDLIGAGRIGLVQAAQRYDASKGTKFATFASIRIRGEMLDYLRSTDWAPRNLRKQINNGDEGALERHVCSLDESDGTESWANKIIDHKAVDPAEEVCRDELPDDIRIHLNDREALILKLYHYDSMTMAEIGEQLGISQSRVCQIMKGARKWIRKMMPERVKE